MWWEAIDTGTSIALVYHPVWEDERHPNRLFNALYRLYRAIVYGTPIRDIEYIQINVNCSNGLIQRIRYEGSSAASYDDWFATHTLVAIDRVGSQYIETVSFSGMRSTVRSVRIDGPSLRFGVVTWSHQFALINDDAEAYSVPVNMPLAYLTDKDYQRYKMARRSQGDFSTKESILPKLAISLLAIFVLVSES
jgi:hypothetical protein